MDLELTISGQQWIGVVIGAVSYMVLSFVWYMPQVFGSAWMEDEGLTEEKAREVGTPALYIITFVMALISNIAIALILSNVGGGLVNGLVIGLLLGIGIASMIIAPHYMFSNKNRLAWVQSGHAIVVVAVSGMVIGALT